MSEIDRYTPIKDVQTPRIRTRIDLPYHLEEQIGLNTKYLQTLAQISGFSHVRIETEQTEQQKQEIPIFTINTDGSATATKSKTLEITTHTNNLSGKNQYQGTKHTFWPQALVVLQTENLREKLLNKTKNDYSELKKPSNWAIEINIAIKSAVRKLAKKNLIQSEPGFFDSYYIGAIAANHIFMHWNLPVNLGVSTLGRLFIAKYYIKTKLENFHEGSGYRLSIFPGYELDRLTLLQVYSRIKSVVAPLEKK